MPSVLLHKADINQNNAEKSALEWAIKFNNEELVRILISKGLKIPLSALGKAFNSRCSKNIVEMIMDADADIKERLDRGNLMTVLGYIVHDKNAELANLLLSRGANPDSLHLVDFYYPSSLPRTSSWSKWKLLKAYQTTTLGVAASKGDTPMMHILLAAHATVNRTNNSGDYIHPLTLAVIKRKEEATRILLEAGADIQAAEIYEVSDGERKRSLFERALEANDLPICQLLLANGAEAGAQLMQDYYSSQLWEHVKQDDTETVALLLQFGARANDLRKGIPNSGLGLAIIQRNWTMISLLQSAGVTGASHAIPPIDSVETARFLEQSNLLPQLLRTNGQMILIKAILAENEPLTSLLLSHGADLQERDIENEPGKSEMMVNTPLEAALCLGNLSLAQIIIGRGGWVTEAELNAIMWRAGMIQDHSVLLSFINMFGPFSLSSPTAIAMAVLSNDEAAIHHLLAAGVDPRGAPKLYIDGPREILEPKPANHTYTDEMMGWWNFDRVKRTCGLLESVLELAVIHGNRRILNALLGATIWTREEKGRALSLSLHFWDRQFVQDLLDVDADIHQEVLLIHHVMGRPSIPMKVALSEGNALLLRTLLTIDRIVDHTNSRVYMPYAIEHGNIEQFEVLLTANTAVNGLLQNWEGQSLLETAVRAGKNKIVSLLLEAGVDINETHQMSLPRGTALHLAGEMGNMELMKILLEAGARIHDIPTPKHEKTTLWHAIEGRDLEVVNKVLAAGAYVNGPPVEKGGMTPLQQAAKQGNMELVDLFLKAGANVNQEPASHSGATALQLAAIQGYIGIARKLLDAGASVQAPGAERYGRTALEGAAEHGRLDMLQLLLNEGMLIEGNDRIEYIRAIKLAQQNGHHAAAKFLKSFSDWTGVDSACYEEQMFDREEKPCL